MRIIHPQLNNMYPIKFKKNNQAKQWKKSILAEDKEKVTNAENKLTLRKNIF